MSSRPRVPWDHRTPAPAAFAEVCALRLTSWTVASFAAWAFVWRQTGAVRTAGDLAARAADAGVCRPMVERDLDLHHRRETQRAHPHLLGLDDELMDDFVGECMRDGWHR